MPRVLWAAAAVALTATASPAGDTPNFAEHVAPILNAHCVTCHRTGQIGPFPLQTYADARKRAKAIARVTTGEVMPPWKPQPKHGEFLNDRRLDPEQVAVLKAWADGGAPEGDKAKLPDSPKFKEGWQLGEPDLVLTMPKAFTIPAEGKDVYVHFVFPLELKGDKYLKGIEVIPSNRRVAHHAVGLIDTGGTARKLNEKAGGNGYVNFGGPGFIPRGFTPGYVPGQVPRFFDADTAITLSKGSDFVLQMHYHPSGKVEKDQTKVGFYFTDKKPARNMGAILLGSDDIDIPPGKKDYTRKDEFTLPCDFELRSVWGHMHMIGKEIRVKAELPDKTTKELLYIKDWDFNWQDTYQYAKPVRLPKGTVVKAEFVWDNSANHPRNPFRPPRRITHGEGSTDEMGGVILGGMPVSPWDELGFWAAVIGHYCEVTLKTNK